MALIRSRGRDRSIDERHHPVRVDAPLLVGGPAARTSGGGPVSEGATAGARVERGFRRPHGTHRASARGPGTRPGSADPSPTAVGRRPSRQASSQSRQGPVARALGQRDLPFVIDRALGRPPHRSRRGIAFRHRSATTPGLPGGPGRPPLALNHAPAPCHLSVTTGAWMHQMRSASTAAASSRPRPG